MKSSISQNCAAREFHQKVRWQNLRKKITTNSSFDLVRCTAFAFYKASSKNSSKKLHISKSCCQNSCSKVRSVCTQTGTGGRAENNRHPATQGAWGPLKKWLLLNKKRKKKITLRSTLFVHDLKHSQAILAIGVSNIEHALPDINSVLLTNAHLLVREITAVIVSVAQPWVWNAQVRVMTFELSRATCPVLCEITTKKKKKKKQCRMCNYCNQRNFHMRINFTC